MLYWYLYYLYMDLSHGVWELSHLFQKQTKSRQFCLIYDTTSGSINKLLGINYLPQFIAE